MEMVLVISFGSSWHLQRHWRKKQLLNWGLVMPLCGCPTTSFLDMPTGNYWSLQIKCDLMTVLVSLSVSMLQVQLFSYKNLSFEDLLHYLPTFWHECETDSSCLFHWQTLHTTGLSDFILTVNTLVNWFLYPIVALIGKSLIDI